MVLKFTMKNPIHLNAKSFISGLVVGGVAMLTVAASSSRSTTWDYKVVTQELKYNTDASYTEALNQWPTQGWEVVCSRTMTPGSRGAQEAQIETVLKRPKQ